MALAGSAAVQKEPLRIGMGALFYDRKSGFWWEMLPLLYTLSFTS